MSHASGNLAKKLETLTPEQLATVEEFVEFLRARVQDRAFAQATEAASIPAFEAVWNNPEDDAYGPSHGSAEL